MASSNFGKNTSNAHFSKVPRVTPNGIPNPLERAIDDFRPIKVICIGTGISGILCGATFPQQIPNLDLVIYEKNSDVGGCWFENHYPGVRPDLTPHTYQYTFASNPNWSRFYPPGEEFEEYLKSVARKYGVYERTKFSHKFLGAKWIEESGKWEVEVLDIQKATISKDYCDVLVKATGYTNDWRWPNVPGREEFQGTMLHTANWDDNFDPTGKNVAVIGYGSTGVQVMAAIQPIVKNIDHYVRGQVWVPPGGGTAMEELLSRGCDKNFDHPVEERERFCKDPIQYLTYRKKIETMVNDVQKFTFKDSEALQMFTGMLEASMSQTCAAKPEVWETLKPDYPPGCRRIVMGQAWLEALMQENAHLIPKGVKAFTKTGIIDDDGIERHYDAIICATGFDTNLDSGTTPFVGQDGITLAQVWNPDPVAYMSVAAAKMPNFFVMFGPNSAPAAGSIVHSFEGANGYIIKCIKKIQREYIKSMVCRPQALRNFVRHVDWQHSTTVLSANCVTWFKRNKPDGRIITSWPGSALASYKAYENPRFEDFEYKSWLPEDNDMAWLGNGNVLAELHDIQASTEYMDFTDVSKILPVDTSKIGPPNTDLAGRVVFLKEPTNCARYDPNMNNGLKPEAPVTGLQPDGDLVELGQKIGDPVPGEEEARSKL